MNYKEVYTKLFNTNHYSVHDENEFRYQLTLDYLKHNDVNNLIDIGSGRGVLLNIIQNFNPNIKILSTDLDKYHDLDLDFKKINLSNKETYFYPNKKMDVLTCLDVLEHLDKSFIEDVIDWFSKISETQILTIANHPEFMDGIDIHTIQEDLTYWEPIIEKKLDIIYKETKVFGSNYLYVLITKSKL
jgi:cyclopropane fatty-acyl-phospholipid synthase-like methyltransferase